MERQFEDALDDLAAMLDGILADAQMLTSAAADPELAARAASLRAQCERALVDSKKLARLSSLILQRESSLRLVSRRR